MLFLFSPTNKHFLKIWDGVDENALLLARKGGSEKPNPITSSTGELFLRFEAGPEGTGVGYRIRVEQRKQIIHVGINISFTLHP